MSQEKTEKPTPKKLRDSRDDGQVAKTPALGKVLAMAAVFELLLGTRGSWRAEFEQWIVYSIRRAAEADGSAPYYLQALVSMPVMSSALNLTLVAVGLATVLELAASFVQVGFHPAPKGMVKAEALDPVSSAKNMFAAHQWITLLVNILKVIAVTICVSIAIYASFDSLILSASGSLDDAYEAFVGVIAYTERTAIVLLLIFAGVDWVIAYRQFMEQMKMSKEDIDRERKEQYGSKEVRQQRKRFSKELLQEDPVSKTKRANAIVTNPTHFAVALRYHPGECPLPVVMARGADETAQAMIAIGRDGGIPIIRSVWLARTLYSVGREGHVIPRVALAATAAVYKAIVEIIDQGSDFDRVIELDDVQPEQEGTATPPNDE